MGKYIKKKDKAKIEELCKAYEDELNIDDVAIDRNKVRITIKDGHDIKDHGRLLGLMDKLGFKSEFFTPLPFVGNKATHSLEVYSARHTFAKV